MMHETLEGAALFVSLLRLVVEVAKLRRNAKGPRGGSQAREG
jgi:hypothetical protein